jgi:hypothetical protein
MIIDAKLTSGVELPSLFLPLSCPDESRASADENKPSEGEISKAFVGVRYDPDR